MRTFLFSLALVCAVNVNAADPAIAFGAYIGGGSADSIVSVMRDSQGFVYVAGSTTSHSLPVTESAAQISSGGESDIFLVKINPSAPPESAIVYASYFGGTGNEVARAAAIDGFGRVHIVGSTTSTDFKATTGSAQTTIGGTESQQDAFLVTFDANEFGAPSVPYATYLGGTAQEIAYGVTATAEGRVVMTGYTASTDFPLRGAAYQSSNAGGWDIFVADFDFFGTLSYSTYFGGERTDIGRAVAVASDGSILVAGTTLSTVFPVIGEAHRNIYAGGGDAFLVRLNTATGAMLSTYIGGAGLDEVTGLAAGPNGRALISGFTTSADFPTTPNAAKTGLGGEIDGYLIAYDLNVPFGRALAYSTYVGGSGLDVAYGLALDPAGNPLLTGYTSSQDMVVTPGALQSANGGAFDAFLVRFDLTKNGPESVSYSTYLGGAGIDIGYGVGADADGRIYIAGTTNSQRLTVNQPERGGNVGLDDGFILVLR